eukprot:gene6677-7381_t
MTGQGPGSLVAEDQPGCGNTNFSWNLSGTKRLLRNNETRQCRIVNARLQDDIFGNTEDEQSPTGYKDHL